MGATRVIPLVIEAEKMDAACAAAGDRPLFSVLPFQKRTVGIITTGNEVFSGPGEGCVRTGHSPKAGRMMTLRYWGQTILGDDPDAIAAQIAAYIDQGADMVLCTGGMSVDPDDTTPTAIQRSGAQIVSYGAPVLPGAMFLLAYRDGVPVMGLPGCVMYAKRTVFDLVLPRIMAGERLSREDLVRYGEGGLCLNCPVCTFPNCGFGK